jgi:hypothetical protein
MTQFINNVRDSETSTQTESRRKDSDRQAIERGEDDGMIVPGSVTSGVPEGEHPLANTER